MPDRTCLAASACLGLRRSGVAEAFDQSGIGLLNLAYAAKLKFRLAQIQAQAIARLVT